MLRKIIKCPTCEEKGIKQNLAEVLENGCISVQRIRTQARVGDGRYKNHTIICGDSLEIRCGNCGEVVYKRAIALRREK